MPEASRIARLDSRALVTLGGADWRGFLQSLVTQDVETLAPGELRFGALLTPQGRLRSRLRRRTAGRADPAALDLSPAGQGGDRCRRDGGLGRLGRDARR